MYNNVPVAGLISSEAANILNGRAFNDVSKQNAIWSGDSITVDRTSSESYQLIDARLTVLMMVQDSAFFDYMSRKGEKSRGSGLWARFLVCKPESKMGTRLLTNLTSSWSHLEVFKLRLIKLLERNYLAQCYGVRSREEIKFSPLASTRWLEVFNEIEVGILKGGRFERTSDMASKLADNMSRVAALVHYFEGFEGDISLETFELAVSLCCWFSDQFKDVFVLPSQSEIDATELYAWLLNYKRKKGSRFSLNNILQYGPNRLRHKDKLMPVMDQLLSEGKINICERRGGVGVLVEVY